MRPGFRITSGKGFHMSFRNGYSVSVQFGRGNYGDNYEMGMDLRTPEDFIAADRAAGERGSMTAEVAVFGPNLDENGRAEMLALDMFDGVTVGARWRPDEVVSLMWWAMHQEGPEPVEDVVIGPNAREVTDANL